MPEYRETNLAISRNRIELRSLPTNLDTRNTKMPKNCGEPSGTGYAYVRDVWFWGTGEGIENHGENGLLLFLHLIGNQVRYDHEHSTL